jgi:hypothetical protein
VLWHDLSYHLVRKGPPAWHGIGSSMCWFSQQAQDPVASSSANRVQKRAPCLYPQRLVGFMPAVSILDAVQVERLPPPVQNGKGQGGGGVNGNVFGQQSKGERRTQRAWRPPPSTHRCHHSWCAHQVAAASRLLFNDLQRICRRASAPLSGKRATM